MKSVLCGALAVVTGLLAGGCATQESLEPQPAIDSAGPVTKYRLHAGVYYSPQFLEATFMRGTRLEAGFLDRRAATHTLVRIPLGTPGVRLYDELLGQLFEKVTRLDRLDAEELTSRGIDVLIAPSLEHFDLPQALMGHRPNEHAIAYRTTLHGNAGQPLASWVVFGSANHWIGASATDLAQAYIKDAGQKILAGFDREARGILAALAARRENRPAPADLKKVAIDANPEAFPGVDEALAARLNQLGIIAIRVTALSPVDRALLVRASDMRLRLADGQLVEPAALSAIAQVWQRISLETAGGRPKPGLTEALGAMVGDPVLHVARDAIVGNLGQAHAADKQQQLSYQIFAPTLFGERKLGQGKEEKGFVFFQLSHPVRARDAVFTAWIVDPAAMDAAQIEVRLPPD